MTQAIRDRLADAVDTLSDLDTIFETAAVALGPGAGPA